MNKNLPNINDSDGSDSCPSDDNLGKNQLNNLHNSIFNILEEDVGYKLIPFKKNTKTKNIEKNETKNNNHCSYNNYIKKENIKYNKHDKDNITQISYDNVESHLKQ